MIAFSLWSIDSLFCSYKIAGSLTSLLEVTVVHWLVGCKPLITFSTFKRWPNSDERFLFLVELLVHVGRMVQCRCWYGPSHLEGGGGGGGGREGGRCHNDYSHNSIHVSLRCCSSLPLHPTTSQEFSPFSERMLVCNMLPSHHWSLQNSNTTSAILITSCIIHPKATQQYYHIMPATPHHKATHGNTTTLQSKTWQATPHYKATHGSTTTLQSNTWQHYHITKQHKQQHHITQQHLLQHHTLATHYIRS